MNSFDEEHSGTRASRPYAEAYDTLQEVAEKLRHAGPADIDDLVESYRRAMAAYNVCAERLALIRAELEIEIDPASPTGASGSSRAPR
jgi:exodeoxyribonuclease VII small subunit